MVVFDDRESTLLKVGLIQLIIVGLLTFSLINKLKYLALLLFVLLVFIYGARLWSKFSPNQLDASSSFNRRRIFPGEEVHLTVRVENRKLLPVWMSVVMPVPIEFSDAPGPSNYIQDHSLLWYQSIQLNWQFNPQQRGIFRLGPPQLVVGDLMGLYPRPLENNQDAPVDLIVYPRLVPLHTFAHIKRDLFGTPGAKSPVEDPIYLLGTRDYQAGSPSRYIHWTASARLNRLQERIFEPSSQAKVLFILDVIPFYKAGAVELFEQSLEVLASLAVESDRQGFAMGFVTNGTIIGNRSPLLAMVRSSRQTMLLLETLAGLELKVGQSIGNNLQTMIGLASGVSCLLFTLHKKDPDADEMNVFRQRNIPFTTVYCDESSVEGDAVAHNFAVPLNRLLLQEARSA